jgi:hypothetical protein
VPRTFAENKGLHTRNRLASVRRRFDVRFNVRFFCDHILLISCAYPDIDAIDDLNKVRLIDHFIVGNKIMSFAQRGLIS